MKCVQTLPASWGALNISVSTWEHICFMGKVFSCYELSQDRVSLMAGKKSDDIWLFSGYGKEIFAV